MEGFRVLIECGEDMIALGEDMEAPLHLASLMGHVKVAHMLIEHGADVMAQNRDKESPLHLASQ